MLCQALNQGKSTKAFKAMEESPPWKLSDNWGKLLPRTVSERT